MFKEKGYTVKEIGEPLNVTDNDVYKILKKYEKNGNVLPVEKVRSRKEGEGRRLPQAQAEEIKGIIVEHTPEEFKLPHSLWSREAIQELIKQKYGIEMPLTTITDYLKRLGLTCQRPATKQNANDGKNTE